VDAELAVSAVRAVGDIGIRVPAAADGVLETLLELLDVDAEYVRSETVVVMQGALRAGGRRG
jgi:vesicle coat complex subunit